MISRPVIRALMVSAALATSVLLAGCNGDTLSRSAKANKPIPEKLLSEMEAKNMDKGSPMLVRLFKQEAELEVWKQDRSGRFALLKTYPICRWSGDLGPKIREGDRQAPEGFYSITPAQMNPASAYYLSFNMGYPNAYDRAWGRTGSQLMVHGDCSSRGCYAMTDEQISEIYSLGRESFFGGQTAFQVQAYPFRMTPQNMARHRDNPNMAFWRMLKEGNDIFEVTRTEPKVDVCEKKYVFDAEPVPGGRPLSFSPTGKCPAYQLNPAVAEALQEKDRTDRSKLAELISRGAPVAKSRAGIDGGMHPVFATKLPDAQSIAVSDVNDYAISANAPAPGTIPSHVNPPKAPEGFVTASTASSDSDTTPESDTTAPKTNIFSTLARKVGIGRDEPQPAPVRAAPTPKPAPKAKAVAKNTTVTPTPESKPTAPRIIPLSRTAQAGTAAKPDAPAFPTPPAAIAPASQQTIAGAQPAPSASFNSRWSSFQ
ncbi:L,D-transpeptidase family protein [Afipia carboxidovorans]|uniref:L,D-transpeptidase family protein n=1 Tax=Afipia carboxidovorans TaxID=40137 RepID=UPI00308EE5E0|nr:murein L,D-transpeptidase [Afipia carboxidovorans]